MSGLITMDSWYQNQHIIKKKKKMYCTCNGNPFNLKNMS